MLNPRLCEAMCKCVSVSLVMGIPTIHFTHPGEMLLQSTSRNRAESCIIIQNIYIYIYIVQKKNKIFEVLNLQNTAKKMCFDILQSNKEDPLW